MSAHKFGPWTFVEGEYKDEDGAPCSSYVAVIGPDSETIIWSNEEAPDDADKFRLIAAAPELLAALQSIVDASDSDAAAGGEMWWAEVVCPFVEAAKPVIAKALGESA